MLQVDNVSLANKNLQVLRGYIAFNAGDPAVVIHRLARDLHADLIVVGQSRHRWMHPLGSVPARLAQHAQQPVLIVP